MISVPLALLVVSIIFSLENTTTIVILMIFLTILLVVLILLPRRTKKGHEALNYIKGLKLFLSVTDKDRFAFHNAPDKSPELFMKYLPYAVALGVEKEWAEVFGDMTIPQPTWYEGGGVHGFSAVNFTRDISVFSSSFTNNSGTTGSSDSGSSGGGGGGGGGGSW